MGFIKDIKQFFKGAMDQDSAPERIEPQDFIASFNCRTAGTTDGDDGYVTNIESNILINGTRGGGINKCIGAQDFPTLRIGIAFIYNSAGFHQIIEIDVDTMVQTVVFTNKTDSAGIDILSLDPAYYVTDIKFVNDTFLLFRADNIPPAYINYTRLKSGFYGTLTANDFSLCKPQNLIPATSVYSDDASRSVNLLNQKLFQFISQFEYIDLEFSAWSTMSKRTVPITQGTPTVGTNVTLDNNLIVSINIGDDRVNELYIGARYDELDFFLIKNITRAGILSLVNTSVDISNQIYEAYDPTTNIYSFVFYNDGLYQNIDVLDTDLYYDDVPLLAGAMELANGNIDTWWDYTKGYPRPTTAVNIGAVAYNPGIAITSPNYDYLQSTYIDGGSAGSGAGDHKRTMQANFLGLPKQGDTITMYFVSAQDSTQTFSITHPVVFAEQDNLLQTMLDFSGEISALFNTYSSGTGANASSDLPTSPQVIIRMVGPPYYELRGVQVILFNAGAGQSKSIHGLKSNSSYQAALSYYDDKGRFLPLDTDNSFVFKTQSYAQILGQTQAFQWAINTVVAPIGAVSYQWMLSTNNTHQTDLFINGALVTFKGTWNATSNTPTLAAYSGTVGDSYLINVPGTQNLGNGSTSYNANDFVVYNGTTWDVSPVYFGDLTDTSDYLVFNISPLSRFNKKNSSSILSYDYSPGDRATFAYFVNGATNIYFNNPVIDVEIVDFDVTNYLLKVRKSSSLVVSSPNITYNGVNINGTDVLLEIYSPLKRTVTTDGVTTNSTQTFFEIGERFPIINGNHTVLSGTITDGDNYYKTREVVSAVNPNNLLELVVEDFNFSDFYISNYTSYGRVRSYDDVLETTTKIAGACYSGEYVVGSKINNLTRFFPARVYGEADGQTSANYGAVNKVFQRNNEMVIIQQLKVGYVPVFESIVTTQAEQQLVSISDAIFGNIRYNNSGNIGMGGCKESFSYWNNNVFFVDPNRSEPIRAGLDGVHPISGKMSKFFKMVLQQAIKNGFKIIGYYDSYNNEYIVSIQTANDTVITFPFDALTWQYKEIFATPLPSAITITVSPSHGSVSYDNTSGLSTYTPNTGYVGTDNYTFSLTIGSTVITKRVCISVLDGNIVVYPFAFIPQTDVALNTTFFSNSILVGGNTIPAPISITGGQYSINGGSFTSAAGSVNPGDTVQVSVLSASSNSTPESAVLTIGAISGTFTVTTLAFTFAFTPQIGVNLSTLINSNVVTYTGVTAAISVVGGSYSINGGSFTTAPGTINTGNTVQAQVLSSSSNNTPETCTVTIGGVSEAFTATTYSLIAGILIVDVFNDPTGNFCGYVNTPGATIPYQVPVYTGQNFMPNPSTPPADCWALASDVVGTSIEWRFEFNITQLVATYPAETSFVFIISGRSVSAGSLNGQYVTKSTSGTSMSMSGSPGSYLPGASGPNVGNVSYSGRTTVGGANGTYGVGVGAVIMTFTYDVALNTVTLT